MKKNTMLIFIVAIIVIAGGAYALIASRSSDDKTTNSTNTTTQDTAKTATPTDTSAGAGIESTPETESNTIAATITYGNSGFRPLSVTIKAGDTIKVVNSSSGALDFESDPHPVHTDDPELNAGSIAPGSSKTFKVNNKGTWGYHNHENENDTGTVIVE